MDNLERIAKLKGQSTSLITYVIAGGTNIWLSVKHCQEELKNSGEKIKDSTNRKNVKWAWRTIIAKLKDYKAAPENGLAVFVGKCMDHTGYYVWRSNIFRTSKNH